MAVVYTIKRLWFGVETPVNISLRKSCGIPIQDNAKNSIFILLYRSENRHSALKHRFKDRNTAVIYPWPFPPPSSPKHALLSRSISKDALHNANIYYDPYNIIYKPAETPINSDQLRQGFIDKSGVIWVLP